MQIKPVSRARNGRYVPLDKWVEYEQRKRRIAATAASSEEYEARVNNHAHKGRGLSLPSQGHCISQCRATRMGH